MGRGVKSIKSSILKQTVDVGKKLQAGKRRIVYVDMRLRCKKIIKFPITDRLKGR